MKTPDFNMINICEVRDGILGTERSTTSCDLQSSLMDCKVKFDRDVLIFEYGIVYALVKSSQKSSMITNYSTLAKSSMEFEIELLSTITTTIDYDSSSLFDDDKQNGYLANTS